MERHVASGRDLLPEHGDYPDGHWERKRRRSTGTESATDGSMRSPMKLRPRPQPKPVAPKEPPPDLERSRQLVVELERRRWRLGASDG